jgi:hypothetical protein
MRTRGRKRTGRRFMRRYSLDTRHRKNLCLF